MALFDRLYLNIGAMKAGTTWLYRQLEQHPDILFSPEKELHYHASRNGDNEALSLKYRVTRARNALARAPGGRLSPAARRALAWYIPYVVSPPLSARWYRRRFPRRLAGGAYCADFSNLTAVIDDGGWAHVRDLAETVRLSYVLRHPVQRVWSHLKFLRQLGTSRAATQSMTPEIIQALDARYGLWRHSQYSETIGRLRRHFDSQQIRILFYDDIAARPAAVLRDLEDFLAIGHHDYAAEKLERRINVSAADVAEIPDTVQAMFAQRLQDELVALGDLDIEPPVAWRHA